MKNTDFAMHLSKYFTNYMPNDRGHSPRTIESYRYSFMMFLTFMNDEKKIGANQIKLREFTRENVIEFLNWIEEKRKCSAATRNQRLAALKGFTRYLLYEYPDYLEEYQKILGIAPKTTVHKEISYLKTEGVELLVSKIKTNTRDGYRDYIMILLLYTTGIRVSELINIRVKDLSLTEPYTLLVCGKGNKKRYVPLMKTIVPQLRKYLENQGYYREEKLTEVLFKNHLKSPFTRQGVNYIINKYADIARRDRPDLIPHDLSPHKMRHTTAMELVTAGVELMYIRDLLGHTSISTTEIYARTDTDLKRKALEAASREIVPTEEPEWDDNHSLLEWLKSFNQM